MNSPGVQQKSDGRPRFIVRRIAIVTASLLIFGGWLALSALSVHSGPNVERGLRALFGRYSRVDAFDGVNGIVGAFWCLHSVLSLIAAAALYRRRFDVLTVLLIGPALAALLLAFEEDWSDPAWFTIVGVTSIGEIVSSLVALA